MNATSNAGSRGDDRVEALLRQAAPRPVPPADDERTVRAAVRAEWQALVASRRRNRRLAAFAAAAGVALAMTALFATLGPAPVGPVPVATIDRSLGTIYLLGDRSELVEASGIDTVSASQVIVTAPGAALGLAWGGGGSLRVDEDSRIEFIDRASVFLHRGRLYFDSGPPGSAARLVVATGHGTVTHSGTQFMAAAAPEALVVSVREGRVSVDGRYFDATAVAGRRVEIRGTERPVVVDLSGHGAPWEWTEAVAPRIDLDGRSAYEFLQWIGRQTGYEVVFEDTAAEQVAVRTRLVGKVEADLRTELRLRMMTTDLEYAIDPLRGTIKVTLGEDARP